MERISKQRHLLALRNGLLAVFPLTLIGTIFYFITIVPMPEAWALKQFIVEHTDTILIPYRMTVVLITLYMVIGVGANLAKSYSFDKITGSLVSLAAFLMTTVPVNPSSMVPEGFIESATKLGLDTAWYSSLEGLGWVMPQTPMSGVGVYVGALSAIFGVEMLRFTRWLTQKIRKSRADEKIKLPDSIAQAVNMILPIFVVIVSFFFIRHVLGFDMQAAMLNFIGKLIRSSTSLSGAMIYVFVLSLFSFFGLIGFSVSGSAAGVAWGLLIAANSTAHIAGAIPPYVAPLPFFHYFVWIGGVGATLSVVILMCFSKSKYLKRLGFSCLVPSLVNINLPAVYGMPLILNPYMFIPFILGPQVTTLLTYFCMKINFISRPYANPAGNFPFAVGAFMSTGDWKAILLSVANLLICMAIYYPFFKVYEKKLISEGEEKAKEHAIEDRNKVKITDVDIT